MPDRGHRGRHAGGLVRTLLVPILLSAGCLSTRVADLWEKQPDRTAVFAGDYRDLSVCVADALRHSHAIGELDYEVAPGPGERQSVTGYTQAPYYRLPTVDFTFAQHGDKITVESRWRFAAWRRRHSDHAWMLVERCASEQAPGR